MKLFLAILCVSPSAWVNAEAQLAINAGWSMIAAVIGFAVLAAIFTMACANAIQQRQYVAAIGWGAVAGVFMAMNMMIALSGISGVREAAADIRAEQIKRGKDEDAIRAKIAELRKEIGATASASVIETEMLLLSGVKWDRANVRLAKVKQVESLEAQALGWEAKVEPKPSSVDPGVANIAALVVAIFNVRLDERFLAAALSGSFALLLELGADLGPIAIAAVMRHDRGTSPVSYPAQRAGIVDGTHVPVCHNVSASCPPTRWSGQVEEWIGDRCETRSDAYAGTTELANDYNLWAERRGYERITITTLGTTLRNLGYAKEKSGKKRYVGLCVKPSLLRIVK